MSAVSEPIVFDRNDEILMACGPTHNPGSGYVYVPPTPSENGRWFARAVAKLCVAAFVLCVGGLFAYLVRGLIAGVQQ